MPPLNMGRIITAGLAAGLVMNVIDALTNGVVLGERWQRETQVLNPGLMAKIGGGATAGWIVVDFLVGILLVWVYAAARTRLGAGPRTAVTVGIVIWLISHAAYASYAFMGLYSPGLVAVSSIGGLIAILAGAYVGGRLYREV
jgi:hypothetical protein